MADVDIVTLAALEHKIGLRRPTFGRRFVRMDRWLVAESVAVSKLTLGRWRSLGFRLNSLDDRLELPRLDLTKDSWSTARQNGVGFTYRSSMFGSVSGQRNASCFLSCAQPDHKAAIPRQGGN